MTPEDLAATAIRLLVPYLGRTGQGLAQHAMDRLGESALAQLGRLHGWVATRLSDGDDALVQMEHHPDDAESSLALQRALTRVLEHDVVLAAELTELVGGAQLALLHAEGSGATVVGGNLSLSGAAVAGRDMRVDLQYIHSPAPPTAAMFQLPPDIIEFTGRRLAVAEIEATLCDAEQPLAVGISAVAGKGGVGKTTLAVHAAHRLTARFPDGQLYVNLRGVEPNPLLPMDVLADLLCTMGVEATALPGTLTGRQALYRTRLANKRILLVLDNAADESQIRPLLPGSSSCAVLVTSRRALLGLAGIRLLHLDVLDPDQAIELLGKLCGSDRIEAEHAAAARIVQLCGYLPLAIRIAGAKLAARPDWTLARLADLLADEMNRLDELIAGDMEVRTTFLASYDGQSDEDRRAFRLLGVMEVATFPAWVVAPLLNTNVRLAEKCMDRLVAAQLVESVGADFAGQLRYRLHDLLRDLARERLATEDSPATRAAACERWLSAYLQLADRVDQQLRPGGPRHLGRRLVADSAVDAMTPAVSAQSSLRWFVAERTSLLSMVTQMYDRGLWSECWHLADAVSHSLEYQWRWDDLLSSHELGLNGADRTLDTAGRAAILCNLGAAHREFGRAQMAEECLRTAIKLFDQLGDDVGRAQALNIRANLRRRQGHLVAARSDLANALRLFRRQGNQLGIGWTLRDAGWIYRSQGRLRQAVIVLESAYNVLAGCGEHRGTASALRILGDVHRDRCSGGHPMPPPLPDRVDHEAWRAARTCFTRARQIAGALPDRRELAWLNRSIGELQLLAGDLEGAEESIDAALRELNDVGDRRGTGFALCSSAALRWAQGNCHDAIELAQRSVESFTQIEEYGGLAWALVRLGFIRHDCGDVGESSMAWDRARTLYQRMSLTKIMTTLEQWVKW